MPRNIDQNSVQERIEQAVDNARKIRAMAQQLRKETEEIRLQTLNTQQRVRAECQRMRSQWQETKTVSK